MSILLCYETVIKYTENKIHIVEQIISVLKDLIRDKNYKTGSSIYGGNFVETYKLNYGDKFKLSKKLKMYEEILNPSSNNELVEEEIKNVQPKNKSNIKGSIIAIDIFLGMLIIGSAASMQFVSSLIMLLIFLIITFENISYKLFKNDKKKKKNVIIILIIALFFTIASGI